MLQLLLVIIVQQLAECKRITPNVIWVPFLYPAVDLCLVFESFVRLSDFSETNEYV